LRVEVETQGDRRFAADPAREKVGTAANLITVVRTVAAAPLALLAAQHGSLMMLLVALATYWIGDILDGTVARLTGRETRFGAVLDILCDRFCAATFYVGLAWLEPDLWLPIAVYLAEFLVVDAFLSLAFLAWPIVSPNYFYVVDRRLWQWNWSKPGKVINSAAFAVLLVGTGNVALGTAVAAVLLAIKLGSLVRLMRIGLPLPSLP
jgi:CDP-diacylglycerol--glycerol-3-phosphate 3-phosphatidyltransferase